MKATKKVGEVDNEVEDYIQDDRYGDVNKNKKTIISLDITTGCKHREKNLNILYIDWCTLNEKPSHRISTPNKIVVVGDKLCNNTKPY